MFCDAKRTQQHARQQKHVQSTVANNRSTAGLKNHHQKRPQVAKTNKGKMQNGQQSTGVHCSQFLSKKGKIFNGQEPPSGESTTTECKVKGKVFYCQEAPSGESTTTECGVNYQLLGVITEVAQ